MSHNKYRNLKTGSYASRKEARRAQELQLLVKSGHIRNLREQVAFTLIPKQGKERACKYIADFVYDEDSNFVRREDGSIFDYDTETIVEDVKSPGSRTAEYIIKRKLLLWRYGIAIRET